MAIAWVCKDDYEHAGFKMLPKNDSNGWKASLWILIPLIILIPTVYKLYVIDLVNWLYLSGSLITTAAYLYYGIRFTISRDKSTAKALMFSSFVYLPLIWILIFADWMIL
jgi:protoheme IX farnesyltransferase